MTQWTITKDHFADQNARPATNCNAAGIVGPRGATMTAEEIVGNANRTAFKMYTDDKELVYEGYLVGDNEFAPLDHFGGPNFGCTMISVRKGRKWIMV